MVIPRLRGLAWAGGLVAVVFAAAWFFVAPDKEIAPEIRLRDLAGKEVLLSQLRGKTVVVNFWATWCSPCREEMPEFVRFYEENQSRGVVVLGVAMDKNVEKVKEFIQRLDVSYPVVIGDIETARLWKVRGLPMTFVVTPKGRIAHVLAGGVSAMMLQDAVRPSGGTS